MIIPLQLDPNCENLNLNKYSKNYLNHLFNTNEILSFNVANST